MMKKRVPLGREPVILCKYGFYVKIGGNRSKVLDGNANKG